METFDADIAVKDGKINAIGQNLGNAEKIIDAEGMLVLPGGIDAHCHIEQESSTRIMTADDFYSAVFQQHSGGILLSYHLPHSTVDKAFGKLLKPHVIVLASNQ